MGPDAQVEIAFLSALRFLRSLRLLRLLAAKHPLPFADFPSRSYLAPILRFTRCRLRTFFNG